jgi:hypothetical protein
MAIAAQLFSRAGWAGEEVVTQRRKALRQSRVSKKL